MFPLCICMGLYNILWRNRLIYHSKTLIKDYACLIAQLHILLRYDVRIPRCCTQQETMKKKRQHKVWGNVPARWRGECVPSGTFPISFPLSPSVQHHSAVSWTTCFSYLYNSQQKLPSFTFNSAPLTSLPPISTKSIEASGHLVMGQGFTVFLR